MRGFGLGARLVGRPLRAWDFALVAGDGFGDPQNNRAQSLAWFGDRLYVGVTRYGPASTSHSAEAGALRGRGGAPGQGRLANYLGQRGQIWRFDPTTERWQRVLHAPMVRQADGSEAPREAGYRKMTVFQGVHDPSPTLYVSTISPLGSLILRSTDGEQFTPVNQPPLAQRTTWSFRALVPFGGRLFAAPSGRVRGDVVERNIADAALLFESEGPGGAPWRPVSEEGFGDPTNATIYELAAFNGWLYAGTLNPYKGFQVWKTRAEGDPYEWRRVVTDGAFRGAANQAAASMCVFRDSLYVGTGRQAGQEGGPAVDGPAGAELIRINPDDSWDLMIGEPRRTFDGMKQPLSGLGPGFGNGQRQVIWELAEHDGWLYAGTENLASFAAAIRARMLPGRGARPLAARGQAGGFHLWRSRTGTAWELVTDDGFGNPSNFGVESMLSTPVGLFVGSVTIPPVGGTMLAAGGYRGGCEVWWGSR